MKIGIYLVRDAKAEAFMSQPIMATTPGIAERQFITHMRQPDSMLAQYPGDFSLWVVGELEMVSGVLTAISPRELVNGPQVLSLVKEA